MFSYSQGAFNSILIVMNNDEKVQGITKYHVMYDNVIFLSLLLSPSNKKALEKKEQASTKGNSL